MKQELIDAVRVEEARGLAKWGETDTVPDRLLAAATEELGEVAHGINHGENQIKIQQEITEVIGILSRLYNMVGEPPEPELEIWECDTCGQKFEMTPSFILGSPTRRYKLPIEMLAHDNAHTKEGIAFCWIIYTEKSDLTRKAGKG